MVAETAFADQPRDTCRMDLNAWQSRLDAFAAERGWTPYLNAKNLAVALSVEASELLELFQWLSPEEAQRWGRDDANQRERLADEMADVLMYLLHLSRVTGIDLEAAAEAKLVKNAVKYPAPKAE